MIKKIQQTLKNNKKIVENFSYLTILQFFSLLFPLITYPYLLRVLGLEVYGSIVFANSITMFIAIIINFGFNITGTRDIACCKENRVEINKIVSSIYTIKFALWFFCLLIYFLTIYFTPFLREDWLLYTVSFFLSFNDLLFPTWFFQGIEKMKYITFINIGVRLLFVISIFVLVGEKDDYLLVPILNATGALIGGLIALYVVFVKEQVHFIKQPLKKLKFFFYDSSPLFLSSLSTQIYVKSNKVIVGSFLGMEEVAIYDLGEKITSLLKIPVGMISQATFPKISRELKIDFVNKVMLLTTVSISILYVLVYFGAISIVEILSGAENEQAVIVLRILSFSVIISAVNLFLGGNRLLPFGYKKYYVRNAVLNSIFYIIGFFILFFFSLINIYTLAYLYLLSELFVLGLNIYKCYVFNLLFISKK
jgi:O-antigen/teichoic acid export membrane protein